MFVFCIWDEKNNYLLEKISLEKNHYFIIFQKHGFMFSSEIRSFLEVEKLSKNLD